MVLLNKGKIDFGLFPNNELKVPVVKFNKDRNTVKLVYENSNDLILLEFISQFLDDKCPKAIKWLIMKYVPYERMDRQTENQMFTCKYFSKMINKMGFSFIAILDPHSMACTAALDRVGQIDLNGMLNLVLDKEKVNKTDIDAIFFPDNGANKKYSELLKTNIPMFFGNKHRDLDTGKITDYNIIGNFDVIGKNILIFDDICVKGYTTMFAAQKLKRLGAKRVVFYCSHCENAIFDGGLLKTDFVDKIYTTDSIIRNQDDVKIECLDDGNIIVSN